MSHSKIKAVIFDIDEVLVMTMKANASSLSALLIQAGYSKVALSEYRKVHHLTYRDQVKLFTRIKSDKRALQIIHKHRHLRKYPFHKAKLPAGLKQTLDNLAKQYKMAVVTNRMRFGAYEILDYFDLKKYFSLIVTFDDFKNPKPHPEPLRVALKKLKVEPNEAVYVGDAESDMLAARGAGVRAIYFSRGKHPKAHHNVRSFKELYNLLNAR